LIYISKFFICYSYFFIFNFSFWIFFDYFSYYSLKFISVPLLLFYFIYFLLIHSFLQVKDLNHLINHGVYEALPLCLLFPTNIFVLFIHFSFYLINSYHCILKVIFLFNSIYLVNSIIISLNSQIHPYFFLLLFFIFILLIILTEK